MENKYNYLQIMFVNIALQLLIYLLNIFYTFIIFQILHFFVFFFILI